MSAEPPGASVSGFATRGQAPKAGPAAHSYMAPANPQAV